MCQGLEDVNSVMAGLDIFALEQSEQIGKPELASGEIQVNEIPLGPAACDRADFHACDISCVGNGNSSEERKREEQWIWVSKEANLSFLDDRMERMWGFRHQRKAWRLLDALEHGLFVEELAHKQIQVHREPVTSKWRARAVPPASQAPLTIALSRSISMVVRVAAVTASESHTTSRGSVPITATSGPRSA
jgi:hypothetical protein